MTDTNAQVREALDAYYHAANGRAFPGTVEGGELLLRYLTAESALIAAIQKDVLTGTHEGPWTAQNRGGGDDSVGTPDQWFATHPFSHVPVHGPFSKAEARAVANVLNLLGRTK